MDTTVILILLSGVVLISMTIVIISQMREKARIEQARRTASLEDAYNRARRCYDELPGQYLNQDLKLLLLQRMEEVARMLEQSQTGLPVQDWLAELQTEKQAVVDGTDKQPELKVDSTEKANYIKELLQVLFRLVENLHNSNKLSTGDARTHLQHILFLIHKTHADLQVFQAREWIRQNQLRKAIHCYHLAATEMNKSRDNPLAQKAADSFRRQVQALEEQLASGEHSQAPDSHSKLDREWDEFLSDDSWKKKADYDH